MAVERPPTGSRPKRENGREKVVMCGWGEEMTVSEDDDEGVDGVEGVLGPAVAFACCDLTDSELILDRDK